MIRLLNSVTLVLILVFMAVQFNDPDGPLWALYYGVPAAWAFVAGWRARWLAAPGTWSALLASVAIWAVLVVVYWPTMPRFWQQAVWWEEETAREGMGMMVALAVLLIALASAWRVRRGPQADAPSAAPMPRA